MLNHLKANHGVVYVTSNTLFGALAILFFWGGLDLIWRSQDYSLLLNILLCSVWLVTVAIVWVQWALVQFLHSQRGAGNG
jgi:hypothetical protein